MNIVVAGTGYVGLVTGACLSEMGHNVLCVDVDPKKVETMRAGISPIYEPGLDELLVRNVQGGRLEFTTDYKMAYSTADVVFIGVGTPEREDGSANLDYVYRVCDQIVASITKDCLVVIKSTVPVGTNDKIEEYFAEHKENRFHVEVASNPEFLAQGTAVKDTLHASRIVIGVGSEKAEATLRQIYAPFDIPILATDRCSAEMIKYASNDFLALKISYINEIANFCELVGANIEDVSQGMSYDPRIGDRFLNAGIGYGGSCFPKDTKAMHWLANDYGYEMKTIKATIEINHNQKIRIYRKLKQRFDSLKGLRVAVLGLTFKPGTDDLREAPSIVNISRLLDDGAHVQAFDPVGMENFQRLMESERLTYATTAKEALKNADVAIIFTEWPEMKALKPEDFKVAMKTPILYDGRNCFALEQFMNSGVEYNSIGRMTVI